MYRARILRRASAKRAEAILSAKHAAEKIVCGALIQKCIDIGWHNPPCRCARPRGHEGACISGDKAWWEK